MKKFDPDLRNLGGRKAIVDLMNKHYQHLDKVKPTIDSFLSPSEKRRAKSKLSYYGRKRLDMTEVQETFKRSSNAKKSGIDTSPPRTLKMSQRLSDYRSRRKSATMSEHMSNIKHMQRRINDIGSINERKKNPHDFVTNPVVFLRSPEDPNKPLISSKFIAKVLKKPKHQNVYTRTLRTSMNLSVSPKRRRHPMSSQKLTEQSFSVPFVDKNFSKAEVLLKRQLLDIITKNRIYKDRDLIELYSKTRESNLHLNSELVENAIRKVQEFLDS